MYGGMLCYLLCITLSVSAMDLSSSLNVPKNVKGKVSFLAVQQNLVDITNNEQKNVNIEKSFSIMKKFPGYDLYIFPELSVTGYSRETFEELDKISEPEDETGMTVKKYQQFAKEINSYIVYSIPTYSLNKKTHKNNYYITFFVISPKGKLIDIYRKNYLFTMEQEYFTPGWTQKNKKPTVIFEINGVKLGTVICYDMRFPELWRDYSMNHNVVAYIHSLATSKDFSWNTWETMVTARSIENLAYIISLNRAGDIYGGSMFIQPGTPDLQEYFLTPVIQSPK